MLTLFFGARDLVPRYQQKTVCSQIGQLISVTVCAISKSDEPSVR